ncbi:vegetative cell wall protein gp1-like [Dendrobium catenatum]|uniref:vegetative cell wall protein gp1-like n=1 Tax=Dendrobium catenatum TaxID=906689 RepID=UPI0010A054EC|nr:vegetative cell wall protein gp1-like [Dendrobium catenatum]
MRRPPRFPSLPAHLAAARAGFLILPGPTGPSSRVAGVRACRPASRPWLPPRVGGSPPPRPPRPPGRASLGSSPLLGPPAAAPLLPLGAPCLACLFILSPFRYSLFPSRPRRAGPASLWFASPSSPPPGLGRLRAPVLVFVRLAPGFLVLPLFARRSLWLSGASLPALFACPSCASGLCSFPRWLSAGSCEVLTPSCRPACAPLRFALPIATPARAPGSLTPPVKKSPRAFPSPARPPPASSSPRTFAPQPRPFPPPDLTLNPCAHSEPHGRFALTAFPSRFSPLPLCVRRLPSSLPPSSS